MNKKVSQLIFLVSVNYSCAKKSNSEAPNASQSKNNEEIAKPIVKPLVVQGENLNQVQGENLNQVQGENLNQVQGENLNQVQGENLNQVQGENLNQVQGENLNQVQGGNLNQVSGNNAIITNKPPIEIKESEITTNNQNTKIEITKKSEKKTEVPKVKIPKTEPVKVEAKQPEVPKVKSQKTEPAKVEVKQPEDPKVKITKTGPTKVEVKKTEENPSPQIKKPEMQANEIAELELIKNSTPSDNLIGSAGLSPSYTARDNTGSIMNYNNTIANFFGGINTSFNGPWPYDLIRILKDSTIPGIIGDEIRFVTRNIMFPVCKYCEENHKMRFDTNSIKFERIEINKYTNGLKVSLGEEQSNDGYIELLFGKDAFIFDEASSVSLSVKKGGQIIVDQKKILITTMFGRTQAGKSTMFHLLNLYSKYREKLETNEYVLDQTKQDDGSFTYNILNKKTREIIESYSVGNGLQSETIGASQRLHKLDENSYLIFIDQPGINDTLQEDVINSLIKFYTNIYNGILQSSYAVVISDDTWKKLDLTEFVNTIFGFKQDEKDTTAKGSSSNKYIPKYEDPFYITDILKSIHRVESLTQMTKKGSEFREKCSKIVTKKIEDAKSKKTDYLLVELFQKILDEEDDLRFIFDFILYNSNTFPAFTLTIACNKMSALLCDYINKYKICDENEIKKFKDSYYEFNKILSEIMSEAYELNNLFHLNRIHNAISFDLLEKRTKEIISDSSDTNIKEKLEEYLKIQNYNNKFDFDSKYYFGFFIRDPNNCFDFFIENKDTLPLIITLLDKHEVIYTQNKKFESHNIDKPKRKEIFKEIFPEILTFEDYKENLKQELENGESKSVQKSFYSIFSIVSRIFMKEKLNLNNADQIVFNSFSDETILKELDVIYKKFVHKFIYEEKTLPGNLNLSLYNSNELDKSEIIHSIKANKNDLSQTLDLVFIRDIGKYEGDEKQKALNILVKSLYSILFSQRNASGCQYNCRATYYSMASFLIGLKSEYTLYAKRLIRLLDKSPILGIIIDNKKNERAELKKNLQDLNTNKKYYELYEVLKKICDVPDVFQICFNAYTPEIHEIHDKILEILITNLLKQIEIIENLSENKIKNVNDLQEYYKKEFNTLPLSLLFDKNLINLNIKSDELFSFLNSDSDNILALYGIRGSTEEIDLSNLSNKLSLNEWIILINQTNNGKIKIKNLEKFVEDNKINLKKVYILSGVNFKGIDLEGKELLVSCREKTYSFKSDFPYLYRAAIFVKKKDLADEILNLSNNFRNILKSKDLFDQNTQVYTNIENIKKGLNDIKKSIDVIVDEESKKKPRKALEFDKSLISSDKYKENIEILMSDIKFND